MFAKGYAQTFNIYYEDMFFPIANIASIWARIIVVASKVWLLHQMDVKNAFLYGDSKEEMYMFEPPHYEDLDHPGYVCRFIL